MPIHIFRSTDAGAPTLNGIAGTMIAVLDAVLLNGYNTKTVTITRSGSTATVSATAHGFVLDQVVEISGAAQTEYNGQFKVESVPDANSFTITVSGTPATPATGSISCKVAALGWTKEFSGTNLAAYRMPVGTTRFRLRVEDTSGAAARVRGFESMTAVSTGTGPFPTTAQFADPGLYWWKSDTASSEARAWTIISDGKMLHIVHSHTLAGNHTGISSFGDIKSYRPGDAYNCMLIGSAATSATATGAASGIFYNMQFVVAGTTGHFIAREYFQEAGAAIQTKVLDGSKNFNAGSNPTSNILGSNGLRFPNPVDGALVVSKLFIGTPDWLRGEIPGILVPIHYRPFDGGYRFAGQGDLAGNTYLAVNVATSGQTANSGGQVFFKMNGDWS